MLIGLVGPCAAGKSTISAALKAQGYEVRHIAQEHSYVQDMWLRITNPDILVFLDVSYTNTLARRNLNWTEREYKIQLDRLAHAGENADLYINTNDLTPAQVIEQILKFVHLHFSNEGNPDQD